MLFRSDEKYDKKLRGDLKGVDKNGITLSYKGLDFGSYIKKNQKSVELVSGGDEVKKLWEKGVNASQELTKQDRNYPAYGFKIMSKTINSNSAYASYSEIMGLKVHNFRGVVESGIKNRIFTSEQTEQLKKYTSPDKDQRIPNTKPSLKNPSLPRKAWNELGFETNGKGMRVSGKGSDGVNKEYTVYAPDSVHATNSAKITDPFKAGQQYLIENARKQQQLDRSVSQGSEAGIG